MRLFRWLFVPVIWAVCVPAAKGQALTYDATVIADTFGLHEPVWVHFVARNMTADTIPAMSLEVDAASHRLWLYDDNWVDITGGVPGGTYVPHPSDVIRPMGIRESFADLNWRCSFRDSSVLRDGVLPETYFPPGVYHAVFRWRYDPWGRATVGGSPYLWDTVTFCVVIPQGSDSLAMESYLNATRQPGARHTELLWRTYEAFPHSRYAPACLEFVAIRMRAPDSRLPWLSFQDVVRRLVLTAPDHPRAVLEIKDAARYNEFGEDWAEKSRSLDKGFLRSISDSVPPQSRAGKICAGLLNGVENEVLRFTPGLKLKKDRDKK